MISRRLFLSGSAAGAVAVTAPVAAAEAEHPVTRLHRLADEASHLMPVWNEHMGSEWELQIRAACPIDGADLAYINLHQTPQRRYDRARQEFIAATKALHPDVSDWRVVRDEDPTTNTVGLFFINGHRRKEAKR